LTRPLARALAVGALSGILLRLAYPPADQWWLGWVALVPLFAVVSAARTRGSAAAAGFACGAAFFGPLLVWIMGTIVRESHLPLLICPLPWLLLVAYLAAYPALWGALTAGALHRYGPRALLLAPVFWTGAEWLRGRVFTGFPWGLLGASQESSLVFAQSVALAGVFGTTLVLACVSAALAAATERGLPLVRRAALLGIPALLVGACWLWGTARMIEAPPASPVEVACVQGAFGADPDPARAGEILAVYQQMTRDAAAAGARLVLWPESATPLAIEMHPSYRDAVETLSRETGAELVVASIGGPAGGPYANSAYLVRPGTGVDPVRYDKIHLVPWGEYVPWPTWFVRRFVDAIGEFETGQGPVIWDTAHARVSPLICYEAIFPPLARAAAARGAGLLVNLTNDGWFGESAGPAQHLALARLRAIETALPMARCANTGISAVVDGRGRVLAESRIGERTVVSAALPAAAGTTPYLAIGESVPIACAILTLLATARELAARRRPAPEAPPRARTR